MAQVGARLFHHHGFLRELGYELVKPHVARRSQVANIHSATRNAIARIGVEHAPPAE